MKELADIIRMVYPISDADIELLKPIVSLKELSKNELLFVEGVNNNNFYVVKTGLMRFYHVDDGKDYTICFAGKGGAVASLHSYLFNKPSMCNIEAVTEASLYEFPKDKLEALVTKSIHLSNWVRLMAFEELYTLERRFTYVGTGDAYSRYIAFMQMRPQNEIQEIPLKYIASYLRITPQTLSKMRKKYVKG